MMHRNCRRAKHFNISVSKILHFESREKGNLLLSSLASKSKLFFDLSQQGQTLRNLENSMLCLQQEVMRRLWCVCSWWQLFSRETDAVTSSTTSPVLCMDSALSTPLTPQLSNLSLTPQLKFLITVTVIRPECQQGQGCPICRIGTAAKGSFGGITITNCCCKMCSYSTFC